jgi:hypothetical protein
MEFAYWQLTSILTSSLHKALASNPSCDLSGQLTTTCEQIDQAFELALLTPALLLDAVPVLRLPAPARATILSALRECKGSEVLMCCLVTITELVQHYTAPEVQVGPKDFLLIFNLLHTRKSLHSGDNWFPMCLPGISSEGNLQCFTSIIETEKEHLIFLAFTDNSDMEMFYYIRNLQKLVATKITNPGAKVVPAVHAALARLPHQVSLGEEAFEGRLEQTYLILAKQRKLGQLTGNGFRLLSRNPAQHELQELTARWAHLLQAGSGLCCE